MGKTLPSELVTEQRQKERDRDTQKKRRKKEGKTLRAIINNCEP